LRGGIAFLQDPSRLSFREPSQAEIVPRKATVHGFGDTAWRLRVGEIGSAPFDPPAPVGKGTSKFAIHIIKRLQ
jgi:hypothetical protein